MWAHKSEELTQVMEAIAQLVNSTDEAKLRQETEGL